MALFEQVMIDEDESESGGSGKVLEACGSHGGDDEDEAAIIPQYWLYNSVSQLRSCI